MQSSAARGRESLPVSPTFGNVLLSVTDFFNFCEMMYDVKTGSDVAFYPPLVLIGGDNLCASGRKDGIPRTELCTKADGKDEPCGPFSPCKATEKFSHK